MTRNGKNYTRAKIQKEDKLKTGIQIRITDFVPAKVLDLSKEENGNEIEI